MCCNRIYSYPPDLTNLELLNICCVECLYRISCSSTDATQYTYFQSDGCDEVNKSENPDYHLFSDQCIVFDTIFVVIDINNIMSACIKDNSNDIIESLNEDGIAPVQNQQGIIDNIIDTVVSWFSSIFS